MSEEALREFCSREHPRLARALTLYLGQVEIADELAQEALVRVCEQWPRVCQMRQPGAWAHRVAMNLAKSWLRRRLAERRAHQRYHARPSPARQQSSEPAEAMAVRQAVAGLPQRQRQAVVLRYVADLSAAEAGEVMGIASATVRVLTSQALQRLRAAGVAEADRELTAQPQEGVEKPTGSLQRGEIGDD